MLLRGHVCQILFRDPILLAERGEQALLRAGTPGQEQNGYLSDNSSSLWRGLQKLAFFNSCIPRAPGLDF